MNIITKTITVSNYGTVSNNVKTTITLPSPVSISSFPVPKGYVSGNVWTIPTMQDGEIVEGKVNLLVPSNYQGSITVNTEGSAYEVDISDNTASSQIQTPAQVSCAPPNAECGQPTVSLLEGFKFGVIQFDMAINSCLSTHCLHRFSVSNLVNVKNLEFNKANGKGSLQPSNPFLPWSFDFTVKSYDCTVDVKGKTQFEPDGPKTISGDALYTTEDFMAFIGGSLETYNDRASADADVDLEVGEWFVVKDETYADQGILNIKL